VTELPHPIRDMLSSKHGLYIMYSIRAYHEPHDSILVMDDYVTKGAIHDL
jgi:hypothetical protein